jgi:hypothetical protein
MMHAPADAQAPRDEVRFASRLVALVDPRRLAAGPSHSDTGGDGEKGDGEDDHYAPRLWSGHPNLLPLAQRTACRRRANLAIGEQRARASVGSNTTSGPARRSYCPSGKAAAVSGGAGGSLWGPWTAKLPAIFLRSSGLAPALCYSARCSSVSRPRGHKFHGRGSCSPMRPDSRALARRISQTIRAGWRGMGGPPPSRSEAQLRRH